MALSGRVCCCQCGRTLVRVLSSSRPRIMSSYRFYSGLQPYTPPPWAAQLRNVPTQRILLANLETPIHQWNLPGVPKDFQVFIKRDDMTGSTLSGNKVRKLEFLLADAVKQGCKHVITCGGIQSNHCRATAVAARQLGLKCHLVLRTDNNSVEESGCAGNMLLNKLVGCDIYYVPKISPYETHLKPRMHAIAKHIQEETGKKVYHICVGGSDTVGLYGYLNAFHEMTQQGLMENFDDIVFACGSGGTAEGLAVGNLLTGSKLRIHGVAVSDSSQYFTQHINNSLSVIGLTHSNAEDIVDIVEGYKGKGYGLSTQVELDFILEVSKSTGIMLDPVYTGKAVRGLVEELRTNPSRFQGKRILFMHTGGIFGMYDGRLDATVNGDKDSKHYMWPDLERSPF